MVSLKIVIKKFLKIILYIFLFLFMTFTICEIWFRLEPESPSSWKNFKSKIAARVGYEWLNENNKDVLFPPFKLFSNTDFDNMERLRFIVKITRLPRNTTLKSYDFLRPEELKEKTSYTATINNLGFRDPPRTIQKPKNVFRIIVLGTYSAFGHAVSDDDAYPRQLEGILNNLHLNDMNFEVWNGGRHAATAIVGLARLKTEILNYNPDLIIWDYGQVDQILIGDDNFPRMFLYPNTGIYRPLKWLFHLTRAIVVKSAAITRFENDLINKYSRRNEQSLLEVNKRMIEFTKQNNIPVILLQQLMAPGWPPAYQELLKKFDHVILLGSAPRIFKKYPPPPQLTRRFHSEENWLSEFNPDLGKITRWNPPEYFKDVFQYNEWGYKAIAEYLADTIEMNFPRLLSIRTRSR